MDKTSDEKSLPSGAVGGAGKVLATMLDEQRNLTRFYLSKLKGEDMHREFEVNGYTTNSAYWILAHLCWGENMLAIQSLGGKTLDIPWLNDFKIHSPKGEKPASQPSLEEVLDAFKQIHAVALETISNLTEAELDEENMLGIAFGENTSKRFMAMHAIRHEGTHCGQLSLIAKMYGKKTV
ncbi:MAG: DinB family protein [Flavobacteriales bacterium]|nr:DinB family protein [Flavobacteriales bacterium]